MTGGEINRRDREAAMEHTEYVLAIINRELTAELAQLRTERDKLKDDSEYERDRQYDRGYALGLKAGWQHATTYWEAVRQEDAGETPSPTPEQLRERHRVSFEAHFYPSAALTQREGETGDE